MSTREIAPIVTGTLARMFSRNPVRPTLTSYCPGSTFNTLYAPFGVGHRLACQVGFLVDDRHGRARDEGPLPVLDDADDAAVENLRDGWCCREADG